MQHTAPLRWPFPEPVQPNSMGDAFLSSARALSPQATVMLQFCRQAAMFFRWWPSSQCLPALVSLWLMGIWPEICMDHMSKLRAGPCPERVTTETRRRFADVWRDSANSQTIRLDSCLRYAESDMAPG